MLVRQERTHDVPAIRGVVAEAFRGVAHSAPPVEPGGDPGEVTLVDWLRADTGWLPHLSLVAEVGGVVVGHVVCTRAHVDEHPVLGLGPLSVLPEHQRAGVGSALLAAVLDAARARGERLVGLLGDPAYYSRFGFVPAASVEVISPDPAWGEFFQVLPLGPGAHPAGRFTYAEPFSRLG